jgi:putative sporulation protein YtxC
MDYLDVNHNVNLEGFVRFRLKDYLKQIDYAVDDAVAEYDAEQEQHEFIELLRYFMASQDSRIDTIEVVLSKNGLFRLLDDSQNTIDNHYLEGFVADLAQGAVDYGDLLISALITLAPKKLRCHCDRSLPVLETLKGVFAERMTICEGCEICGRTKGSLKGSVPARPRSY